MREKRVWRYYCEFCGKAGCRKYAMQEHEAHCTMNPNRECRMCEAAGIKQKPITELSIVCTDDIFTITPSLDDLKDMLDGCPACILAAFRQAGLHPRELDFDYQKECEAFWSDVNEAAELREYNAMCAEICQL